MRLVKAATFSGRPDLLLVAFAWVLAKFDARPDRYGWAEFNVLWRYKWVLSAVGEFPQFSRTKCDELLLDLSARFAAAGAGRHAALGAELGLARDLGDRPREAAVHAKYVRARRTYLSNCPACVANGEVNYHANRGRYARAVAAADPILSGNLTCEGVPKSTYADLLEPLWELGRLDEAMDFHTRGYRLVARDATDTAEHARHAEFLVLTGNTTRAATLAGKHLAGGDADVAPAARLRALSRYRVVFAVLADRGVKAVKLAPPAGHPLAAAANDGKIAPDVAFAWVDTEARTLAAAFDARNGNAQHSADLDRELARKDRIKPYPRSPRRAADGPA